LATDAENIAHSWCFRRDDQTAQHSAADCEDITHRRHICQEQQIARRSAAAIKKSNQLVPAFPAPTMVNRVTRSESKTSVEALTPSGATGDAFT